MSDGERVIREVIERAEPVGPPAPPPPGGPPAGGGEEWDDLDAELAGLLRNDVGNSERLRRRFGADLLHVQDVGWHVWTGKRWSLERGAIEAQLAAHKTAVAIFREAAAIEAKRPRPRDGETLEAFARRLEADGWERLAEEPDHRFIGRIDDLWTKRVEAHRKFANASGNAGKLEAMQSEAAPYLTRAAAEMDADPWRFNVDNGTLLLRPESAGGVELQEHRREDLITRISPVAYNPEAACPEFQKFLARVLPDPAVRVFMQRFLGYALTGDCSEQVLVLMHGMGANGKGTLVEAVQHVMGDYAMTIPFATLLQDERKRGSEATPDIARLPGARLVTAAEPDMGAKFSEGLVKQLTGQDVVTARHLNHGFFEFVPQFKLVLSFNHKPQVRGQDEGIWRRFLLVPFEVVIPPRERDLKLRQKLKAEAPGILNWLLDGLRLWLERGLEIPDAVRAATEQYREDSDPLGQFLGVAVRRPAPGYSVTAKLLYGAYCGWCRKNAVDPVHQTLFGRLLAERGFRKDKAGIVYYREVELLDTFGADGGPGGPPPPEGPGDYGRGR